MSIVRSLSSLGNSIRDLEYAADERFADARALHSARRFPAAIANGVYSLEIVLKIVICRRLDLSSLPRAFQTHDLDDLLILTGLSRRLTRSKDLRPLKQGWDEITKIPDPDKLRYGRAPSCDQALSERILAILSELDGGLIPWLLKQV